MLPLEFRARMSDLLGDEAEIFFAELENGENARSFFVNASKISVEDFEKVNKINAKKMEHINGGYYTDEEKPGNTAAHHSGMIYMQDPGAMSTVCAVKVAPGMRILDCCAAPGGKSSQLFMQVGEGGLVVSNEYVSKRASILQGNLERMGSRVSVVLNLDARELEKTYTGYFDLVVCDAPCSGEGMFRKNELAISEWSVENVQMCAKRQWEILDSVKKCVGSNGQLLYSTCTFSLEENEYVVDRFLSENPDFELVPVNENIRSITSDGISFDGCVHDMSECRRFYPHVSKGEGQFIALFQRSSGGEPSSLEGRSKSKSKAPDRQSREEAEALRVAQDFLSKHLTRQPNKKLVYHKGFVCLCPDAPLPEYGVLMRGVCVGEVVKGRLVPHHQLFSAYGSDFKNKLELSSDDERVAEYIKGMEIDASGMLDGYAALLCDGCALGGVKVSGGRAKNHYPKGLRSGNL